MPDLPDFYSFVLAALTRAINLTSGLDAAKAASPTVGDVYLATDTAILYVCYTAGTWVNVSAPYFPTRELFIPASIEKGTGAIDNMGAFLVVNLNVAAEFFYFPSFKCPHDFTSLTHCKVVCHKSAGAGTIDWTVTTNFAAEGEIYNTHADSDTDDDLAMAEVIELIDISDAFTNLAADDYVGVQFKIDAISTGDLWVVGLVFKYS